jgi:dTDP-L-rhamnose 4-epimerase
VDIALSRIYHVFPHDYHNLFTSQCYLFMESLYPLMINLPMGKRILITGGAGFIGSHLADELLAQGHSVRILDSLLPQVHGSQTERPYYLNPEAELITGDIEDAESVRHALDGIDAVYHLAARVGVGQSMYRIASYTAANCLGTANLLEAIIERPVERLIVASSMSIYGEGLYRAPDGALCEVSARPLEQLKAGQWDVFSDRGEALTPAPTPETKTPSIASVYALDKYHQERLCLMVGGAYGIPTVGLRFFNVYGTRQALSNPYTGVLAIFASRLLNHKPPLVYEDGRQRRDFVSIHDVVQACQLVLDVPEADGRIFNVGSGNSYTILEIAHHLSRALGQEAVEPEITGKYRTGDIRHCFADISLARQVLGYQPRVTLGEGLQELADWLAGQEALDKTGEASAELMARGLTT